MSVHVDNGGLTMTLKHLRRFVEYTENYDEKTLVFGGVTNSKLMTEYVDLHGLETRPHYVAKEPHKRGEE